MEVNSRMMEYSSSDLIGATADAIMSENLKIERAQVPNGLNQPENFVLSDSKFKMQTMVAHKIRCIPDVRLAYKLDKLKKDKMFQNDLRPVN